MFDKVLRGRDDLSCPPGKQFYSCGNNNFRGCCSVDPCHLPVCPDAVFAAPSDSDQATTSEATRTEMRGPSSTSDALTTLSTIIETLTGKGATKIMTDSGTTRTIPNNSVVTVTRKTVILTDKAPTSTPTPTATSGAGTELPARFSTTSTLPAPATSTTAAGGGSGSSPSTGTIVGAAIGGAVVLAIFAVLAVACLRRRKGLSRSNSNATSNDAGRLSAAEKVPQTMSAHSTGTQEDVDPFAPFGGRVDKPVDPYAPKNNTFEMDATSTAPIELPAVSIDSRPTPRIEPPKVPDAGSSDPRANLNASLTDRRQHTYVNHWNQWRNLAQEER